MVCDRSGRNPVLALGQVTSSGLSQVRESVPQFFTWMKESEVAGLGQGEESPRCVKCCFRMKESSGCSRQQDGQSWGGVAQEQRS